jgi:transposase
VIQVCIYRDKKVLSNVEMTPDEFLCWLINAKPATIIFEACGTSNYWLQRAKEAGHDARLISAEKGSAYTKGGINDTTSLIQDRLKLERLPPQPMLKWGIALRLKKDRYFATTER